MKTLDPIVVNGKTVTVTVDRLDPQKPGGPFRQVVTATCDGISASGMHTLHPDSSCTDADRLKGLERLADVLAHEAVGHAKARDFQDNYHGPRGPLSPPE